MPDMEITEKLIQSTALQVDIISIIDNSPVPTSISIDIENFHYHHFPNNTGIAAAHNIGLTDLRAAGCIFGM